MLDELTGKKLFFWRKSFLRRFCAVVLPGPAQGYPGYDEIGTVDAVETYVGGLHPLLRLGMAGLFDLMNFQAIFWGYFVPMSMLPEARAKRYLHRLESSPLYFVRNLFTAAKAIALLLYYSDIRVEKRTGYVDDCMTEGAAKGVST